MYGQRAPRTGRSAGALCTLALVVVAGCGATPAPTGDSAAPQPTATPATAPSSSATPLAICFGLQSFVADECAKVAAAIRSADPGDAGDGAHLVVVDRCPPQVLCDRPQAYDLIALVMPQAASGQPIALHASGGVGTPIQVEPWSSPLPDHVKAVLAHLP